MPYEAIDNQGFALIRQGKTIGSGDPVQPTDAIEALVDNVESLDKELNKPLIFRTQQIAMPIGYTPGLVYFYRRWLFMVPRTSGTNGEFRLRTRAAPLSGSATITVTIKQDDLVTFVTNVVLPITGTIGVYGTFSVDLTQVCPPDTWHVAELSLQDVAVEWCTFYCLSDGAVP